jgi:hypothetical protein
MIASMLSGAGGGNFSTVATLRFLLATGPGGVDSTPCSNNAGSAGLVLVIAFPLLSRSQPQTAAASHPKIVDGGAMIRRNGN